MAYKHVIGLKTDVSQSNLGGNTDSNHLIPGVVGYFSSVSLSRHPVQLVILIPFFFSPALNAGLFFVLCPSLYLGPCFYSAGCYPAFSYVYSPASDAGFLRFVRGSLAARCFFVLFPAVFRGFSFFFSPASDAGVLPPLWRGRVLPFTVQSRDHLATITDIYVPSFLRPVRGSLAPRLLLFIPRH